MKFLTILIVIFFGSLDALSELNGLKLIDSLFKELPNHKADSNEINILNAISYEYLGINPAKTKEYAQKALELSDKIGFYRGKASALKNLGNFYWASADYNNALEHYNLAMNIFEDIGDKEGIVLCLGNMGIVYSIQSDYPNALEHHLQALQINEETGDKIAMAKSLGNIANVYQYQYHYEKALEYYFKALKICEELGNQAYMASNLVNIGAVYSSQADYPKALEYYFRALNIHREAGNTQDIAVNLGNIGVVYQKQSDYTKALEYFFEALEFNMELGRKNGTAINLGNIGETYFKIAQDENFLKADERSDLISLSRDINIKKGLEFSHRAAKISAEIGSLHQLMTWNQNLYKGYKLLGAYSRSLEAIEEFIFIKDSVFNQENARKLANLESKREKEVAEKELEIQKLENRQARNQIYFLSGGLIIALILLVIIFIQRKESEKLLLNILPKKIAKRLKGKKKYIADRFEVASVVFIDQVDFTKKSSDASPEDVVRKLNVIYTQFDKIAYKYGLEKIKTIGDCYMAAAGVPEEREDHAEVAAKFALEAMSLQVNSQQLLNDSDKDNTSSNDEDSNGILFRCGIDSGAVIAGVIGEHKFIYDIWGDTVNTASRMEDFGEPGKIQVSDRFKSAVDGRRSSEFQFTARGEIEIKGKGKMRTWFMDSV